MLTRERLLELDRSHRSTQVLSVYIDGSATDPAERTAWRRQLRLALDGERENLRTSGHDEREAYDRAVAALQERLSSIDGMLPSRGWVAFVTRDAVLYAEEVPVPMTSFVAWGQGIRMAPYLRALEEHKPAFAAVIDSRLARVYRYQQGSLEKLETLRAHTHVEPVEHMGYPPASGFHTGTRGSTGTDEAERELRIGRERLIRDVTERLMAASDPDGWIRIGGIPELVSQTISELPERGQPRSRRLWSIDVHATEAQIIAGIEAAVTDLRRSLGMALVDQIFALSARAGNGTLGLEPTQEALRVAAVDHLCFTERFVREHEPAAETIVRAAFDEGAEVELVSGAAADRLDASAGGIGARLRYVPYRGVAELSHP